MARKSFHRTVIAGLLVASFGTISPFVAVAQSSSVVSAVNVVQSWTSVQEPDGATTLAFRFTKPFSGDMGAFVGPTGDYLAIDLPGLSVSDLARQSGMAQGAVKSVRFVESGKRLRAIVQIEKGIGHRVFVQDGVLVVRFARNDTAPVDSKLVQLPAAPSKVEIPNNKISPQVSIPVPVAAATSAVKNNAPTTKVAGGPVATSGGPVAANKLVGGMAVLRDIEFKRTGTDSGQLVLDLSDPGVKVKVYREGMNLALELPNTALPRNLAKRLRVENMETPVQAISPSIPREGFTKLLLESKGGWDYKFAQNNNSIVIDVFKIGDDYKVGGKKVFTGKKLSLSFQQIEVRTVLQILAEFTGLNIIASESVAGTITLRLNEVPWDQALDIILTSRNLDMRRNGQVIWIAPKDEVAKKELQDLTDRQAIEGLEPMFSETFQLYYQRAEEMKKVLVGSKGGSIMFDARTNVLFIKDTAERLEEMRKTIQKVDIPVQQVNIEAKIVEVTDTFAKSIGVKFGMDGLTLGNKLAIGSNVNQNLNFLNRPGAVVPTTNSSLNVNLPSIIPGAQPGSFAFTLFNSSLTKFLDLEVNALETDGKAKTISSPRVITEDGVKALIKQGSEVPYRQITDKGTQTSFKDAFMSLEVTPKITPDGRVTMALKVNKDTIGQQTQDGLTIDKKEVETSVQVDDGGTIVIGGIFIVEENTNENKVPLLGDLPIVGRAFKNNAKTTTKKEMVIMITPRIVKSDR
jgi:type IV pilus assembly protein PilQ